MWEKIADNRAEQAEKAHRGPYNFNLHAAGRKFIKLRCRREVCLFFMFSLMQL